MFATLCSPSLVFAARRIAQYKAPIAPVRLDVSELQELVTMELSWLDSPLHIALELASSKRTLQRRIEAEGNSYQQILKETREALARHYLEKTAPPSQRSHSCSASTR
jgi:hypothetical protein